MKRHAVGGDLKSIYKRTACQPTAIIAQDAHAQESRKAPNMEKDNFRRVESLSFHEHRILNAHKRLRVIR